MDHKVCKNMLSALLDGELAEKERGMVLAHLETCEECQTYFAELNAMHDAFGDPEPVDVPEGFAAGVIARLHEEPEQSSKTLRQSKRRAWRGWVGFAACAAIVVLAIGVLPLGGFFGGSSAPASTSETAPVQSTMTTASSAPAATAALDYDMYVTEDAPESAEPETPMASLMADEEAQGNAGRAAEIDEYVTAESVNAPADEPAETGYRSVDAEEGELPVVTLMGEGAADWLAENGEPLGDGKWRVTVAALNALPDTLAGVSADGLQEPAGGTLIITLGTTGNPR